MCSTAEEPETQSDFPPKLWFSAKLAGLQIPGLTATQRGQERWLKKFTGVQERRAGWPNKEVANQGGKKASHRFC